MSQNMFFSKIEAILHHKPSPFIPSYALHAWGLEGLVRKNVAHHELRRPLNTWGIIRADDGAWAGKVANPQKKTGNSTTLGILKPWKTWETEINKDISTNAVYWNIYDFFGRRRYDYPLVESMRCRCFKSDLHDIQVPSGKHTKNYGEKQNV